jgi:hypothetical protein
MARWQTELAAEDVTGRDSLRGTLDDLEAVGAAARRADSLLADLPGIASEASLPVMELLDRQLVELPAAVARERLAIALFVTAERQATMVALGAERRAALASIGQEREAMMAGLDALAERSIADAFGRTRGLVDYVFLRVLVLIAVAALLGAAGYSLARGRRRP